jgi:hypothetical protein
MKIEALESENGGDDESRKFKNKFIRSMKKEANIAS